MIIYGINSVQEALRSERCSLERIWIQRRNRGPRVKQILQKARKRGVPVSFESAKTLTRKASGNRHQDVIAQLSEIQYLNLETVLKMNPSLLLLVDKVEDPRNLGALLRTAEAVGVAAMVVPARGTCPVTAAVVKSSAGAALHLKIARVGNLVRAIQRLKDEGFWIVGLDMAGKNSIDEVDTQLPVAVLVGGEHHGLRPLVRKQCDFHISLTMKGQVPSLNLSVAAGVLLYQITATN